MTKSSKPNFSFPGGEDPERLRQQAEAVKAEFSEPAEKVATKTTTVRLPQPLLTRARSAAVQQKDIGGPYQTLTAIVVHGLEVALDELEQGK